jgi:hypothetical protein
MAAVRNVVCALVTLICVGAIVPIDARCAPIEPSSQGFTITDPLTLGAIAACMTAVEMNCEEWKRQCNAWADAWLAGCNWAFPKGYMYKPEGFTVDRNYCTTQYQFYKTGCEISCEEGGGLASEIRGLCFQGSISFGSLDEVR